MRIASFNINGIKARLPRLLEWLEETRPTVACLQEIKTQDDGFPAEEFERIGYKAIWHGQKGFNGVAILADGIEPVEAGRGLPGDPEDVQARYIEADVGGIRVVNLYLPNGNPHPGPKFDYKIAWMERLSARLGELLASEIPTVVVGDFNVIPEDKDVWSVQPSLRIRRYASRAAGCISASAAIAWTDHTSLSSGMTLKSPTTTVGISSASSSPSRARSRSIQAIL